MQHDMLVATNAACSCHTVTLRFHVSNLHGPALAHDADMQAMAVFVTGVHEQMLMRPMINEAHVLELIQCGLMCNAVCQEGQCTPINRQSPVHCNQPALMHLHMGGSLCLIH